MLKQEKEEEEEEEKISQKNKKLFYQREFNRIIDTYSYDGSRISQEKEENKERRIDFESSNMQNIQITLQEAKAFFIKQILINASAQYKKLLFQHTWWLFII